MRTNKIFICCFALLVTGCATNAYNIPFVDATETVLLTTGMNRSDVLSDMGQPLYVEYGDESTGEIFWVYEVRGKNVKSDIMPTGEQVPNKTHSTTRPTAPIHRLRLEFMNDKLYRWMPIQALATNDNQDIQSGENNQVVNNIEPTPKDTLYVIVVNPEEASSTKKQSTQSSKTKKTTKKKKKSSWKFFAEPRIQLNSTKADIKFDVKYDKIFNEYSGESYESDTYRCYGCYQTGYVSPVVFLGFEKLNKFRLGPEIGFHSGGGIVMFKFERLNISPANLHIALGMGANVIELRNSDFTVELDNISGSNEYCDNYDWQDQDTYCLETVSDIKEYEDYEIMNSSDGDGYDDFSEKKLDALSMVNISLGRDFLFQGQKITPRYTLGLGDNITHSISIAYNFR